MDFEVRRKLQEAEKSGRYMVGISYLDKDGKTLQHHLITRRFGREDILPSLEAIAGMAEKEAVS